MIYGLQWFTIDHMKTKTNQKYKSFTARLPEELVKIIDEYAEKNRWSRTTAVRALLEDTLKDERDHREN